MKPPLTACLDTNVYISAIGFGGKPLKVLECALNRNFLLVTSPNILEEVRRNLLGKMGLNRNRVDRLINDIFDISSSFVPSGKVTFINHPADNLVLEVAVVSGCDVLVTGDRRHLLPLNPFKGIVIEPPSKFLQRLDLRK